jgi:hypothetical protein
MGESLVSVRPRSQKLLKHLDVLMSYSATLAKVLHFKIILRIILLNCSHSCHRRRRRVGSE